MKVLIWMEFYKLFKQSRTYFALGAILLIESIILIASYYQGNNIIEILLNNLQQSFFLEGNLLNGNLVIYLILNSLWFNLPLILMIITSGILTLEYESGTLQSIFLHPVNKIKLLFSKYIVAAVFTLLVILLLSISAFASSYLLFGKGDLIIYLDTLNFFQHSEAFRRLIWAFGAGAILMVFYSVVSLTLAVIFKETTKTWIISALFLIVSNLLLKVDFQFYWINKLFFVKLNDTWQYFFYNEIPWKTIYFNNILLLIYTSLFMGLGLFIFHKNDIG